MANTIKYSHQIDAAFKQLSKKFETTRKKINSTAAKRLKSGTYDAATKWMEIGKSVEEFSEKIESVRLEWRTLVEALQQAIESVETKSARTGPLPDIRVHSKQLLIPAIRILQKNNGSATSDEVLEALHSHVLTAFPQSELSVNNPSNFPPWQEMLKKVQRGCQKLGWIERRRDGQWRLTEKGRTSASD